MRHNNEELASSWGNLVNRVANLINKNFGEIPPLDEDSMTNEDRGLLEEASAAFDVVGSSIETHHQKHALSEAMRVVGDINKYISATEPWKIKDDQARLGTVLHVAAQAVSDANHLLAPFLPHSAQKVWERSAAPAPSRRCLSSRKSRISTSPASRTDHHRRLRARCERAPVEERGNRGRRMVPKPAPIFAKIPTEAVEEELARFDEALAARRAAEAERLAAEKAKLAAE